MIATLVTKARGLYSSTSASPGIGRCNDAHKPPLSGLVVHPSPRPLQPRKLLTRQCSAQQQRQPPAAPRGMSPTGAATLRHGRITMTLMWMHGGRCYAACSGQTVWGHIFNDAKASRPAPRYAANHRAFALERCAINDVANWTKLSAAIRSSRRVIDASSRRCCRRSLQSTGGAMGAASPHTKACQQRGTLYSRQAPPSPGAKLICFGGGAARVLHVVDYSATSQNALFATLAVHRRSHEQQRAGPS